jgi:hypothetical protein
VAGIIAVHDILIELVGGLGLCRMRPGSDERKLAALEALKKSLLHQAFTGEL